MALKTNAEPAMVGTQLKFTCTENIRWRSGSLIYNGCTEVDMYEVIHPSTEEILVPVDIKMRFLNYKIFQEELY